MLYLGYIDLTFHLKTEFKMVMISATRPISIRLRKSKHVPDPRFVQAVGIFDAFRSTDRPYALTIIGGTAILLLAVMGMFSSVDEFNAGTITMFQDIARNHLGSAEVRALIVAFLTLGIWLAVFFFILRYVFRFKRARALEELNAYSKMPANTAMLRIIAYGDGALSSRGQISRSNEPYWMRLIAQRLLYDMGESD